MDFIRLSQYIGLGGFIAWSMMERGFTYSHQQQALGQKKEGFSFVLINIFWYGSIFFAIGDTWWWQISLFANPYWALRILGLLFILAGLILRYSARKALGKQYSVHVETSEAHQLVTSGIFSSIRHPAYLGLVCLLIGIPLTMGSWMSLFVALVGGIPAVIYRIIVEEKYLEEWFGEQYQAYKEKSWRLIPYIW
jgi:protein-S-isoprenylcysteine O-methyltransferase Ste14